MLQRRPPHLSRIAHFFAAASGSGGLPVYLRYSSHPTMFPRFP
jgi:hypothetical protein